MADKTGDQTLHSLPKNDDYGSPEQRHLGPAVEDIQLNERDFDIFRECQLESVTQRCAPMAAVAAGLTHFAVKSGKLPPHARFGSLFKVSGAILAGFLLGKLSYLPVCREKFKADPLSALGKKIREKEGGYVVDAQPEMTPDATTPPSTDGEAAPSPASGAEAPLSYDERRRRNRLRLSQQQQQQQQSPPPQSSPPYSSPSPGDAGVEAPPMGRSEGDSLGGYSSPPSDQLPSLRRKKMVNAYGDELEDV